MTTEQDFARMVSDLTGDIAGRPLDSDLMAYLNDTYGPGSTTFDGLAEACRTGVAQGWLADREAGGIKFGRAIKPGEATHGFSVDVVEMDDIKGPHHRHPNGEIDMIVPTEGDAEFDGHGAGWLVYGPDTAHHPTVAKGKAIVLYLLPDGAIEFTKHG
jgi:hypothetical protein